MIEVLLGGIAIVVPVIQAAVNSRIEQRDLALSALYIALTETQIYLDEQTSGSSRNEAKERQLADLWFNASVPLKHFDSRLADLCEHKRDYWADPMNWKSTAEIETNIRLTEMNRRFDKIRGSILTAFIATSRRR